MLQIETADACDRRVQVRLNEEIRSVQLRKQWAQFCSGNHRVARDLYTLVDAVLQTASNIEDDVEALLGLLARRCRRGFQ